MEPRLVPINDLSALGAAGIAYPKTENQARWLFRQRHTNGLAGSFVRVGRRIFIDVPRFQKLLRRQAQ